nr:SDR family oxidoreductase [Streptomyces atroolivaceus]
MIALTPQLAAESDPHGIRADCVSPGMIDTVGSRSNLLSEEHPMRSIVERIPLGRVGVPADVVNAAVFLVSGEASFVTGANLVIDGGWSTVLPDALTQKESHR